MKRRASELLRQAAVPSQRLVEQQLRAFAGVAEDTQPALAERRQLAVLVDAAACDLAALKEEAPALERMAVWACRG